MRPWLKRREDKSLIKNNCKYLHLYLPLNKVVSNNNWVRKRANNDPEEVKGERDGVDDAASLNSQNTDLGCKRFMYIQSFHHIRASFLPTTVLRPVGFELTKDEKTLVETCIIKTMKLMTKNAR